MKEFKRVTIKDVAEAANVSITTVSFVLNGNLTEVSEETAQNVLTIANQLGYVPNRQAQNLQRQKSGFLALVIPDLTNPYFTTLAQAIIDELHQTDYTVAIICNDRKFTKQTDIWNLLSNATFDGGIIISKIFDSDSPSYTTDNFMPFVMLDEYIADEDVPIVSSDNYFGGSMVAEHLIEMGHTEIACITGPLNSPNSDKRLAGFVETLTKHGVHLSSEEILIGNYDFKSGYNQALNIMNKFSKVTAIFCFNDLMALGAVQAIHERGLSIPEDISIIGYDNIQSSAGVYSELTTVDQCIQEVGKQTVKILLRLIQRLEIEQKRISIKPILIKGKTVRKLNN